MRPPAIADAVSPACGIRGSAHNRQSTIRTGDLVVDLETRVVSVADKPVPLTGKEYCIIELLSLRKDTVLTKQMLLDHLYGGMHEPEQKIIDVFVCHLRKKLAQATSGKHYIETVWGRGYRLRDPAPMPTQTPGGGPEDLVASHDEASNRHRLSSQHVQRPGQIEHQPANYSDDVRDHLVDGRSASKMGPGTNPTRVPFRAELSSNPRHITPEMFAEWRE
jgi:DNA-binding winged helix-turn-helix (wHTH) protein